ncbi:YggS family pyridoxal phosphate-dependent enzyme [Cellulomonas taurus]|uniref:YggS family pyridoxal phosphate-dependent enzyme n=1 Tax=Cellulomonas taurus TaxID=2729175 RepID=UPI00145E9FE0|nr:YggS family pyridoxal phosphate-dependent enzyme [Cellulomonas taurus]
MSLDERLARVRDRIAAAESAAGRPTGSVRLLLATKTQDAAAVRAALLADAAATTDETVPPVLLGENRVQELVAKAPELTDLRPELHLIGPLQSNKVNAALRWADCVQSVDSAELAERLHRRCAVLDRTLDVFVQVNVSGEPTKSGVAPRDTLALAETVRSLDRLRLRGLMTIGANSTDQALVRSGFARLRELGERLGTMELSMGMSRDLEAAVAEGATIVRVGTAVFGTRG